MKFTDLPVGSRFRFQGRTYTKVGPLAARDDAGTQRIIPRWAVAEPAEATAESPQRPTQSAPEAALATYHQTCERLLKAACPDPARCEALLTELEAAYRRCLDALAAAAAHRR